MAICKKCGSEIDDNAKFCPNCGEKVEVETTADEKTTVDAEIVDTNKTSASNSDNTVFGVLAYLGILVLIPIIMKKDDEFVKYHSNQGLVLFIVEIIINAISAILSAIPILGIIISLACAILDLGCLVLAILGIIDVVNGKTSEFPYVGKYFAKFKILK